MRYLLTILFCLIMVMAPGQYLSDFDSSYRKIEELQVRVDLVDEVLEFHNARFYTKELARKIFTEDIIPYMSTTPLQIILKWNSIKNRATIKQYIYL